MGFQHSENAEGALSFQHSRNANTPINENILVAFFALKICLKTHFCPSCVPFIFFFVRWPTREADKVASAGLGRRPSPKAERPSARVARPKQLLPEVALPRRRPLGSRNVGDRLGPATIVEGCPTLGDGCRQSPNLE